MPVYGVFIGVLLFFIYLLIVKICKILLIVYFWRSLNNLIIMKKILFSALLGLGFVANAQISVSESFETNTHTAAGFVASGGYTGTVGVYNITGGSCDGNAAIGANVFGNTGTSSTVALVYTKPASVTANGKKIDISFTYSTIPYQDGSAIGGNVVVDYSVDNGTTYTNILTKAMATSAETCNNVIASIPESAAVSGNFKLRVQGISTGASNDFYVFFDKFKISQDVTAIPNCATLIAPAADATGVSVRPAFTWASVENAQNYKLYLGTSAGNYDVIQGASVTSGYILPAAASLAANTKYYVKLVPENVLGVATGCVETSFTTGANALAPYCGPMISSAPTQIAPIVSVNLAGTEYTSDTSATAIGAFSPHQAFVDKVFTIKDNVTSFPLTIKGIGLANNGWAASVFIDWNDDGDFDDAGEAYFNTTATMLRTTTVGTGNVVTLSKNNLAIPTGTSLGNKRVRVKYNFSGTSLNLPLTTACNDLTNGQVEDYTLNYEKYLAVSDINKSNVSVYPNPFKDVLRISDVKDATSVIVSDLSGRTVADMKPATELNLSTLNKGVYIVTIKYANGEVKSTKVIKE